PIAFTEGRLEVALVEGADPGLIQALSGKLKLWTGKPWLVTVANRAAAGPTIREQKIEREAADRAAAHQDPLVQAILETFPGSKVVNVQVRAEEADLGSDPRPEPPTDYDEDDE
ncbi:MAG: tau, partial [Hyphomicrobiales bacterium]|nr:tau [Hyphomicrobiales bacterium]